MAQIQNIGSADFYVEKEILKQTFHAMHYHKSFELYYLVKGQREYFIDDRFFQVAAGDLVLIPRKVLHRTAGKGGLRYLVHFSEAFLLRFFTPETLAALWKKMPLVFRSEEAGQSEVSIALANLLALYQEQEDATDAQVAGILYQLLFRMRYGTNTYAPQDYSDERITQIIHYINEHYNQISDITQIAEHFYISKYYLCRLFKKQLGVPLISYLNMVKIRHACRLINGGCNNLTQVALDCGFNSSSYFCKVFKSEKGISPTQYRKQHRQIKN